MDQPANPSTEPASGAPEEPEVATPDDAIAETPQPPREESSRSGAAGRVAAKRQEARARNRALRRKRFMVIFGLLAIVGLAALLGWVAASGILSGGDSSDPASSEAPATKTAPATTTPDPTGTASAKEDAAPTDRSKGDPEAVSEAALDYKKPEAVDPEAITKANPKRKLVAITLDDGIPYNAKLMDLFEEHDVRCTTFLLGSFAASEPEVIKRMDEAGFEIANHSWDHPFLTKQSDSEIRSQLKRTQDAISKVTGNQAPYMRPPFGDTDARVKEIAGSMGYKVVLWNRTFADTSKSATPDQLYKNVMDGLQPGDIILCHWGSEDTYQAMQRILPEMKRRGFEPVTLSEMLADEA